MENAKLEAQSLWNETPCGTGDFLDGLAYATREWFEEVRRERYETSNPWILRTFDFEAARGKKLLEIGHGIGTDLLEFRRHGALTHGIDITERHHQLAKRNFEVHGEPCTLTLCDASEIAYPSNHFDVVYSLGVLHHTHDTVRCISEAYRVLKPGGSLMLGLYRTYSAFHFNMVSIGLLNGRLRRLGYRGLMATVEHGADGVSHVPLVKTYTKRQLRSILGDFASVRFSAAHFTRDHVPYGDRFLPTFSGERMEKALGWYILAFATK